MNKEEKSLLVNDLCMRLPYGTMVENASDGTMEILHLAHLRPTPFTDKVRPYLRSIETMTEAEDKEYCSLKGANPAGQVAVQMDYLLSHHFDVHGLIPKGLALEAPEGMYDVDIESIGDTEGFTKGLIGIDRLDRIIELLRNVNKVTEKQIAELEYMFKRGLADEFGVKGKELEEKKKVLENSKAELEYLLARREAYVLRRQKRNEKEE